MDLSGTKTLDLNQRDVKPHFEGALKKWTNYILGWKTRYFVLRNGSLLYYKSLEDVKFGCRGAINLYNARIAVNNLDNCRFDLRIYELIWYLRTESTEERQKWLGVLQSYTKEPHMHKHGGKIPLDYRLLVTDKLNDVQVHQDILSKQMHELQILLDNTNSSTNGIRSNDRVESEHESTDASKGFEYGFVDFGVEITAFKAASAAFLSGIADIMEIIQEREQIWLMKQKWSNCSMVSTDERMAGPEMVEEQHCPLGEEDFFDAVESGLEKIEEEAALRKRLENKSLEDKPVSCESAISHPLWPEILRATEEQMNKASSDIPDESWELLRDEENMKMFTSELEVDGVVVDTLKACYSVKGVTGREMCHYFFSPQYRKDWETPLEQMEIVERIEENTIIFHQVYKKVWPTAQRDSLFWSHITHKNNPKSPDGPGIWAVVNKSIEHPQFSSDDKKYVRVIFSACMYCLTEVNSSVKNNCITREHVTCHLTYCSTVNPGGWVPASAVRAILRKEYPKFLNKISSYVVDQTKNKEVQL